MSVCGHTDAYYGNGCTFTLDRYAPYLVYLCQIASTDVLATIGVSPWTSATATTPTAPYYGARIARALLHAAPRCVARRCSTALAPAPATVPVPVHRSPSRHLPSRRSPSRRSPSAPSRPVRLVLLRASPAPANTTTQQGAMIQLKSIMSTFATYLTPAGANSAAALVSSQIGSLSAITAMLGKVTSGVQGFVPGYSCGSPRVKFEPRRRRGDAAHG